MQLEDVLITTKTEGIEMQLDNLDEFNSMQSAMRKAIFDAQKHGLQTDGMEKFAQMMTDKVEMLGKEPFIQPRVRLACDLPTEDILLAAICNLLYLYTTKDIKTTINNG